MADERGQTFKHFLTKGWIRKSASGIKYIRVPLGRLFREKKWEEFLDEELVIALWPNRRDKNQVNVYVDIDYMKWRKQQEWNNKNPKDAMDPPDDEDDDLPF